MTGIEVHIDIQATPAAVWAYLEDIGSHTEWMADAEAIRFTTEQRQGTGTTFDCDTRVGPFRLTDRMTITRWEPGVAMGVDHVGIVRGSGVFRLRPTGDGSTRFEWQEQLRFPWWLGGPLTATVAAPVLRWVWRRNLTRLRDRVESGGH